MTEKHMEKVVRSGPSLLAILKSIFFFIKDKVTKILDDNVYEILEQLQNY